MEFVQVHNEVSSTLGSKVMFGVHRDVQMAALVGKEQRHTCGGVQSVVVSEFGEWKEI